MAETLELVGTFGSRKRSGSWVVPPRIRIRQRMGSTELDFTTATFSSDEVAIDVDAVGDSIEMRVPAGAVVTLDGLRIRLGSAEDHRRNAPAGTTSPRITITGSMTWGSLEVR